MKSMSSGIPTKTVRNLQEFTAVIENASVTSSSPLWYRGCGKSSYNLTPTLYRHPSTQDVNSLIELEATLIGRFRQRSVPYLTRSIDSDWEGLFLMQHFGVPTRLLDWTENPYIALYFAITLAAQSRESDSSSFSDDSAVWMLNPSLWNRTVLQHISYRGGALSVGDSQISGYAPGSEIDTMTNEPVAIYGTHNSPRIVAQRGVFTIFGKIMSPMENLLERIAFPDDSLLKMEIPKSSLKQMRDSIFAIGFTDSVVFPDLEGLARELKRQFGFEV